MRISRHRLRLAVALLAPLACAFAQPPPELKQIMDRLDRLEAENRELREQVRELRQQVNPTDSAVAGSPSESSVPAARLEERIGIEERRSAELAQTKVEASQHFPIRLTGMALVNAFTNSKLNGGNDNPTIASLSAGPAAGGATWRQSIIGLDYRGSQTLWNGKIRGSLYLDFFGGTSQPLNNLLRIRTATFGVDWSTRTLTVAQDKALVAFREPDSLAQVGVSPLTGAGNLWLWEPQIRFEQRIHFDAQTGVNAQVALVQTSENATAVPAAFASSLERYRPGLEGRFEFVRRFGAQRRIEIAPSFHISTTHVAGGSVPSRVYSADWFLSPFRAVELTGFVFTGQNVAHFGTGGIRQGFWILAPRSIQPVHTQGGWSQLNLIATPRLSFHLFAGQHDDRDSDVRAGFTSATGGGILKNQAYGANLFYKLSPNVIASFEALHTRTTYLVFGNRLNNHYDLALAYLF
jgi:hypothetical protein